MERKAKKNIVTGFLTQLMIMGLGLLIPRIMIVNYGSDTNGLTNTLTQIFGYAALLEAGIGQAARNALYGPAARKDREEICKIMSAARGYYWRITGWYALVVGILAVVLPFVLKTELGRFTVCAVILFEGMSGVIRFLYIENWIQLLTAEGKQYVQANINLVNRILTVAVKLLLACMHVNIVLIQLAFFMISLIQLAVYSAYMKKYYPWLRYDLPGQTAHILKDRNAYVLTEAAWTVFSSTDMILISVLFSTALSSVYSTYNMIYSNLSLLLNAVYISVLYMLGQAYHRSMDEYRKMHDLFELAFITAVSVLMSCCSVLAVPFVRLYTQGVSDVEYIYPYLPFLFGMVQLFSWDRYVTGNLSGIAGYADRVCRISVAEALTNMLLSVALSLRFGICGILLATVLALLIKLCYLTWLCNKKIMKRSVSKTSRKIIGNFALYTVISLAAVRMPAQITGFSDFFVCGTGVFVIVSVIFAVLNLLLDPDSAKHIVRCITGRAQYERQGL